jgi:hypothetical protein
MALPVIENVNVTPYTMKDRDYSVLRSNLNTMDQKHLQAISNRAEMQKTLSDIELDPSEDEWKANYINELLDKIDANVEQDSGYYGNALAASIAVGREYASDPKLKTRIRDNADHKAFVAQINARQDLPQDYKDWAIENNPYYHIDKREGETDDSAKQHRIWDAQREVNPEMATSYPEMDNPITGAVQWKPNKTPATHLDHFSLFVKAATTVAVNKGDDSKLYYKRADGNGYTTDINEAGDNPLPYYRQGEQFESLDEDELRQAMKDYADSHPEVKSSLQDDMSVGFWKMQKEGATYQDGTWRDANGNTIANEFTDTTGAPLSLNRYIDSIINPMASRMSYYNTTNKIYAEYSSLTSSNKGSSKGLFGDATTNLMRNTPSVSTGTMERGIDGIESLLGGKAVCENDIKSLATNLGINVDKYGTYYDDLCNEVIDRLSRIENPTDTHLNMLRQAIALRSKYSDINFNIDANVDQKGELARAIDFTSKVENGLTIEYPDAKRAGGQTSEEDRPIVDMYNMINTVYGYTGHPDYKWYNHLYPSTEYSAFTKYTTSPFTLRHSNNKALEKVGGRDIGNSVDFRNDVIYVGYETGLSIKDLSEIGIKDNIPGISLVEGKIAVSETAKQYLPYILNQIKNNSTFGYQLFKETIEPDSNKPKNVYIYRRGNEEIRRDALSPSIEANGWIYDRTETVYDGGIPTETSFWSKAGSLLTNSFSSMVSNWDNRVLDDDTSFKGIVKDIFTPGPIYRKFTKPAKRNYIRVLDPGILDYYNASKKVIQNAKEGKDSKGEPLTDVSYIEGDNNTLQRVVQETVNFTGFDDLYQQLYDYAGVDATEYERYNKLVRETFNAYRPDDGHKMYVTSKDGIIREVKSTTLKQAILRAVTAYDDNRVHYGLDGNKRNSVIKIDANIGSSNKTDEHQGSSFYYLIANELGLKGNSTEMNKFGIDFNRELTIVLPDMDNSPLMQEFKNNPGFVGKNVIDDHRLAGRKYFKQGSFSFAIDFEGAGSVYGLLGEDNDGNEIPIKFGDKNQFETFVGYTNNMSSFNSDLKFACFRKNSMYEWKRAFASHDNTWLNQNLHDPSITPYTNELVKLFANTFPKSSNQSNEDYANMLNSYVYTIIENLINH